MDRRDLNRMFDGLAPEPSREQELLKELLQDGVRRKRPMKNWKRMVLAVAAAALLVTGAAAAVVLPWIDQRVLDHFDVDPEDTQAVAEAVDLLYPGAMELDITRESNGAALHVTQILRDRYNVMILADFTAPEGTQLYMGEPNTPERSSSKGFIDGASLSADFLDEEGERMGKDGLVSFYSWDVLEDDDPLDNHLSLIFTLCPQQGEDAVWDAVSLWVPAVDLGYWDQEQEKIVTVYEGDWSFETPLPRQDIGWVMRIDQPLGELDGAAITAQGELYLSPVTLKFDYKREDGVEFIGDTVQEQNMAVGRWYSMGKAEGVTLTTADGETVSVDYGNGAGGFGDGWWAGVYRLKQVTDPAKFQGGTLTLDWSCGRTVISLDNLTPAEPAALAAE